ncbi:MAG TPA: DUF2252 family protein [Chitinophagaceae bacterium]
MRNVSQSIREFNQDRLPEMLQLKYAAMRQNAFRFYRGTCHLFYEDLAKHPPVKDDTRVWICGDLHLENFGSYKGDNGLVYFDMNDFDESILAPATWEITRLLCSIHIATKELKINETGADQLVRICLNAYISVLRKGNATAVETRMAKGLLKYFLLQVACRKNKDLVGRRTVKENGKISLRTDHKIYFPLTAAKKKKVTGLIHRWNRSSHPAKQYEVMDSAFRIAGTGSIGIHRYAALVLEKKSSKYRLLDIKEAVSSSLKPYAKLKQPAWENEAQRVVAIQKRVQFVSPALLDVVRMDGRAFVLKELQPIEDKMNFSLCNGKLGKLQKIAVAMGEISAFGQLRSSGRQGSDIADKLIVFGINSAKWEKAVLQYAGRYASQVAADYQSFCREYDKGYFKDNGKN